MFGLMRAKSCGMTSDERNLRQLSYCGTCKAVGAKYSAKARLTLNNDSVFLAEILGDLSGERFETSSAQLKSRNCLSIPDASELPKALSFAAATGIALAGLKLEDHAADGDFAGSRVAYKTLRSDVEAAFEDLRNWSFPLVEIRALLASQSSRESNFVSLEDVALPTAETTATFFRDGAMFVGREEVASAMYDLGFDFGRLIYLIDAFEDFERDKRRGKFNAFRAAFGSDDFDPRIKRKAATLIRAAERDVAEKISSLPIEAARKAIYAARVATNVAAILPAELPVLGRRGPSRISLSRRWNEAVATSRRIASGYGWQMPLVFVLVLLFAVAAPAQTREAKSAGDCAQLGFNLMFLGSVVGAVLAFPKGVLMDGNLKRERRWCNWCECGCDCCCDGCCDSCCDGCGCCDCNCD